MCTFAVLQLQAKKYAKHHYLESDTATLCAAIRVSAQIGIFTVFLENNIAVFRSLHFVQISSRNVDETPRKLVYESHSSHYTRPLIIPIFVTSG